MLKITFSLTLAFLSLCGSLSAQTTAFSYQGKLVEDGKVANGVYDFRFRLYPSMVSNTQLGSDVLANDITVENGIFTTEIDFGSSDFGLSPVWLETAVRPGASIGFYTLQNPRQQLLAAPFAIMARQVRGNGIIGSLAIEDGNALFPSYSFTNEIFTGMYRAATNTIGFSVNGVEAMRIDSGRDVGIGTTNATYRLTVRDSNHQIGIVDGESGKVWTITSLNDSGLAFYESGSSNRFSIEEGGNVKVGSKAVVTSSNANPLQILMLSGAWNLSIGAGNTHDGSISWGNVGFTSAPSVAYAGVTATAANMGGIAGINIVPFDVTTTGCKVRFMNTTSTTQSFSLTINFQVIGRK